MTTSKIKTFYVMAEVKGRVAVLIDATSKRAAMARLREGSWDDLYDVSLETVGTYHIEEGMGS